MDSSGQRIASPPSCFYVRMGGGFDACLPAEIQEKAKEIMVSSLGG